MLSMSLLSQPDGAASLYRDDLTGIGAAVELWPRPEPQPWVEARHRRVDAGPLRIHPQTRDGRGIPPYR
jgi:hypothetical protein